MYAVVPFEDKIAIQPDQFDRDPADCLVEEIERKYCNKVVLGVGLCIIFYDFVSAWTRYLTNFTSYSNAQNFIEDLRDCFFCRPWRKPEQVLIAI